MGFILNKRITDITDYAYSNNHRIEQAKAYLNLGFTPIPIKFQGKKPIHSDWQNAKPTIEDLPKLFGQQPVNIGVVLGTASGGLIDVDIDHKDALPFAPRFLPATGMIFGRTSRPKSHWIYKVHSSAPTVKRFMVTDQMVVEIRGDGHQTVFPGSIHENGEEIEFDSSGEPGHASRDELELACRKMAIASLLLGWWKDGCRHELTLGVAGLLAKAGWDQNDALDVIAAVAKEAQDAAVADREACVRTTYDKVAQGHASSLEGYSAVVSIMGDANAKAISKLSKRDRYSPRHDVALAGDAFTLSDIATDTAAAETFSKWCGDQYIYCDGPNTWFNRHGGLYRPISAVQIQGVAMDFINMVSDGLTGDIQFHQVRTLASRQRINSIVELARCRRRVDWGDVDKDRYRLGCADGSIINLGQSGTADNHAPIITKCLGTSQDAKAQCPTWLKFLDRIFNGDAALISYIQRAVGYTRGCRRADIFRTGR